MLIFYLLCYAAVLKSLTYYAQYIIMLTLFHCADRYAFIFFNYNLDS